MSKYIDFTDYNLSQYLRLMKELFEEGRYLDAQETARHFMHYCAEQQNKERVRDSSPTL